MRDERHADHAARDLLGLLGRLGELDAAALAAAAGVDLRLHDDHAGAETAGDFRRFRRRERHLAAGHGHAVARENRFRLILVNFHTAAVSRRRGSSVMRCSVATQTPDANLHVLMTQQ